MKKAFILLSIAIVLTSCTKVNVNISFTNNKYENAHIIKLNGSSATVDGEKIDEFDYMWHIDPTQAHDEVKDSPAEYHTGIKPEGDIYIDHDLAYYPKQDESLFKLVNYDGENEYVSYYKDGVNDDYIFSTLPSFKTFPSNMMHTEEEAKENVVLHIKKAGIYLLEGSFKGQINVDLDDEEAFTNEDAKVTLVLNGVNIECTAAPAIIFNNLFECDNTWEEENYVASNTVDTTNAGANVIIADDSSNTVIGENIFRILKTKYKDEESKDEIKAQKKAYKVDSPFYSCVSMNINSEEKGNGNLTIKSSFEGLDTELHLTINGGNVTIESQDDGINVNEDNVSVLTINGGTLNLFAGQSDEGDGIDSNGFVTLNGGKTNIYGIEPPDNYIDSEDGILCNGGEVYLDGEPYVMQIGQIVWEIGNERRRDGMGFGVGPGDPLMNQEFDLEEFKKKVAELDDSATLQDIYELLGNNTGIPKENFRFEEGENFNPNQMSGQPPMDKQEPPDKR